MKSKDRETQELADAVRRENIRMMDITEGEEKELGQEGILRQIMRENFPNVRDELPPGIQEVNRSHNYQPQTAFTKTHCLKVIENQ